MVGAKHPEQFRTIIKDYFPKHVITSITSFHTKGLQHYASQFYDIWDFSEHYFSSHSGFPTIYMNASPRRGNNGLRLCIVIHQLSKHELQGAAEIVDKL